MQFKHPEILYALVLLVIPILVHLFQLRRFKKEAFTNVKFLKEVTLQTRKSSQVKKWLILCTRLAVLAGIILAFAQPFMAKSKSFNTKKETVIYLDNSFSMETKGANGVMLNRAIQEIISSVPEDEPFTLFTNTETFKNTTVKTLKNQLLQLPFSSKQLSYNAALLKGQNEFREDPNTVKNLIIVSDFQQQEMPLQIKQDSVYTTHLVKLIPENTHNISLDSLYVSKTEANTHELTVVLKNYGNGSLENVSLSLYNNDALLAKTSVTNDSENKAIFSITRTSAINGRIVVEDPNLTFDNELFFNINTPQKINVLSINETNDDFLKRIYTAPEFNYQPFIASNLNYNLISEQNLIILNELNTIPVALSNALTSFKNNGGHILTIPSPKASLNSYNQFFKNNSTILFNTNVTSEKKVTSINFSHPIFEGVFDKKVSNFQYPKVQSYYTLNSANVASILQLEDGKPLLLGANGFYSFTAALNTKNSNLTNSPLIVPTLYNIGKQSLKLSKLYYTIGDTNTIDVPIILQQDAILKVENNTASIIPQQRVYASKVALNITDEIDTAGIYNIKNNTDIVDAISFNYNKSEGNLHYQNLDNIEGVSVSNSFENTFGIIKSDAKINALWKWFVIFALVFLLLELLLLKYFK